MDKATQLRDAILEGEIRFPSPGLTTSESGRVYRFPSGERILFLIGKHPIRLNDYQPDSRGVLDG